MESLLDKFTSSTYKILKQICEIDIRIYTVYSCLAGRAFQNYRS